MSDPSSTVRAARPLTGIATPSSPETFANSSTSAPAVSPSPHQHGVGRACSVEGTRSVKSVRFEELLDSAVVDIDKLKEKVWSGLPHDAPEGTRSVCWRIILGCLPLQRDRRLIVARRRRNEYMELVKEYFGEGGGVSEGSGERAAAFQLDSSETSSDRVSPEAPGRAPDEPTSSGQNAAPPERPSRPTAAAAMPSEEDLAPERCPTEAKILRQIQVDLPRTNPTGFAMFASPQIQRLMERALFCWAIRHPASGYVQGINDLITPFIVVFLRGALESNLQGVAIDSVSSDVLFQVEADAYWCLSKVLGYIQDHYTFGQPGIQRLIKQMKTIVHRIDEPLYNHLAAEGVDFLQFSFRWMNCLLLREFPIEGVIRLWDTYIAEGIEGFSTFHVYVCSVFLVYWSKQLRQMDFQQIMLFMQKFPTSRWTSREIETLIAEAYLFKSLFHNSPKHLNIH